MTTDEIMALEHGGWVVECESPLELCHTDSRDTATGLGARLVIEYLVEHMGDDDPDYDE